METLTHVTEALLRLRERFKASTSVQALLTAGVTPAESLEAAGQQLWLNRRIDTAEGVQLDAIGVIVGQARGGLSDADYQRYLRARIATNRSTGLIDDILHVVDLVVGTGLATIEMNNQPPASFEVEVQDIAITDAIAEFIADFVADAKAAGVRGLSKTSEDLPAEMFACAAAFSIVAGRDGGGGLGGVLSVQDSAEFPIPGTVIVDEGTTAESPDDVVWTNVVSCTATGNDLERTTGGGDWLAGAQSVATLGSGVDGYVQFEATETDQARILGIASTQTLTLASIPYSIQLDAAGGWTVCEPASASSAASGTYSATDEFRILRIGGLVTYWQNGEMIFASSAAESTAAMYVCAVMYGSSSTITDAVICDDIGGEETATYTGVAEESDVIWTAWVNCTPTGNDLLKDAGGSGFNAGAVSTRKITEGSVTFGIASAGSRFVCGFDAVDAGTHALADIDFGVYVNGVGGWVNAMEGGSSKGSSVFTVNATDLFRVTIDDGTITYWRKEVAGDWELLYTSLLTSTSEVMVNCSIYAQTDQVENVVIAGTDALTGVAALSYAHSNEVSVSLVEASSGKGFGDDSVPATGGLLATVKEGS